MPPVTPQGSRAGLITAVVIFVILFVTSTIFAIYYGVEWSKEREARETLEMEYAEVVPRGELPRVRALLSELRAEGTGLSPRIRALDGVIEQRNQLARKITGSAESSPIDATQAAEQALSQARATVQPAEVTLPGGTDNLAGAIRLLAGAVAEQYEAVQQRDRDLAAARQEVQQASTRMTQALAERDEQVRQVRSEQQATLQGVTAQRTETQQVVDQIRRESEEQLRRAMEAQNEMQVVLDTRAREIQRLQRELDSTRARLAGMRVPVGEAMMRQVDGHIVRVPERNLVIIDLGFGDQVTPGLTFEVYDRHDGVPVMRDENEDQLPVGKASIEVVRVGTTSSEARVIRQSPGAILTEGDLLVNLVYDRHTSYNFVVHGQFQLDPDRPPTTQDAEVIKRLITQWGGRVREEIRVDTDFLVIGIEPQLPTDIDPENPLDVERARQAEEALDEYHEVLSRARDLHIPILNQNRFLYFTGYYGQARR